MKLLVAHPRFHLHFNLYFKTTSAFWFNLVERFFCNLRQDLIVYGSVRDTNELLDAVGNTLQNENSSRIDTSGGMTKNQSSRDFALPEKLWQGANG
jgi:hypothetical protein